MIIKRYQLRLNEANDLDEALDLSDIKVVPVGGGKALSVKINGTEYRYVSDTISTTELHRKFTKMAGFSKGKALAWLKKNSIHFSGGKRAKKDVDLSKMKLESTNENKDLVKDLTTALYANKQKAVVKKLFSGKKLTIADWLLIGTLAIEVADSIGEKIDRAQAYDILAEAMAEGSLEESVEMEQDDFVHRAGTESDAEEFGLPESPEWVVATDTTLNENDATFMYLPTAGLLFIATESTMLSKEMTDEEAVLYVTKIFNEGIEELDAKTLVSEGFIF